MKPSLLAFITAVLGFTAGWFLKPAPAIPATAFAEKSTRPRPADAPKTEQLPVPSLESDTITEAPLRAPRDVPQIPSSATNPAELLETRNAAKMARLVEALNLSQEQQDAVQKIVADTQAATAPTGDNANDPAQLLAATAAQAAAIEKALAALLNPEQTAALNALRERSQENAIETAAQSQLTENLQQLDLTPEQRTQALSRIRESLAAKAASRPAAIDLALDTSVLPVAPTAPSTLAFDSLQRSAEANGDLGKAQRAFMEANRQQLEDQLTLYQDILTPAQQAQVKLQIAEKQKVIDRVLDLTR